MKTNHVSALFLLLNIASFLLISATYKQNQKFEKITVREFELVGDNGSRRASIKVESSGEVVMRLMDQDGTIRVKLGANDDGSGLVLLDGSTEPAVHALAKKDGGKVTVQAQGKRREL